MEVELQIKKYIYFFLLHEIKILPIVILPVVPFPDIALVAGMAADISAWVFIMVPELLGSAKDKL